MSKRDYSEDDDFYSQNFAHAGVVSVWAGREDWAQDRDIDTLQDLCGVGYYNPDDQESNAGTGEPVDIAKLLAPFSYAASFMDAVVSAAQRQGIAQARYIVAQYDFAYDPARVTRPIAQEPAFIGVFRYSTAM